MRTLSAKEWLVILEYSEGEPAGVRLIAASLYRCINKAEKLAYLHFGDEMHNGRGDALKHCYLSALLFLNRGEDFATDFMNAHEDFVGNPPGEEDMDRFNNSVGRHIAAANPASTEEQIGSLCYSAVISGRTQNVPSMCTA